MSDQENGREGHYTPAAQRPTTSAAAYGGSQFEHNDEAADSSDDRAHSYPSGESVPIAAPAAQQPGARWHLLPRDLRSRHQWLLAGPDKEGKLKRPRSVNPAGSLIDGSSTDRSTWLPFETACAAAAHFGHGIGYVLSADDPFCCIDLDVKDAADAGRIDLHRRIIDAMESYAERSQSGKGTHVWVRGKIGSGCKRDGVELYSQERFIACTGDVLHELPVADRQSLLDHMVSQMAANRAPTHTLIETEPTDPDEKLIERARSAANAAKFELLWTGQWESTDTYPSQSEADMALMAMLCFYSKSNAQCRRLFRQSALGKREKATKNDRYVDRTLMQVRGRMAKEEDERAQVRFQERKKFQAIGHGEAIDPATLVPPRMSLELMMDALVFISDGRFIAFRDNPLVMRSYPDMKALLRPCKTEFVVQDNQGNSKIARKETLELWMDSPQKKAVHTVAFNPSSGEFCASPTGLSALNLYRPRPHNPPADWATRVLPFLDHIRFLVPIEHERERFLNWLADIEQNPGRLPHHGYLMIASTEGIGRNTLADMLACVWAGHVALSLDLGAVLKDQFNDELSRKFLAVVDEINEGAQGAMWTLAEKLKSFITASVRNMNPKFGRKYTEVNCARLLIFSNHESALPLRATDRRLNVIRNPSVPRESAYYSWLRAHINDSAFIASIREWFRQRDIRSFNPGERAVLNEAKLAVVEATRSEAEDRALELVRSYPRDLITADAFAIELYGLHPTQHDMGKLKHRADEAGMKKWKGNGEGRIRLLGKGGKQDRVWILRNHERWEHATQPEVFYELSRPV